MIEKYLSSRDVNSVRNDGALKVINTGAIRIKSARHTRDDGTQMLGALGELQSEHTTT